MSDSITNTNTKIANTVEDFFAELLKLLDQSDIYDTDVSFLRSLGKDGQSPNMVCVDTMIAKRMVKEMEAQKIPYMQFRIRATGKDIILVSPEMMSKMQAIENSIRIHAGLELDTKAELDRALAISEPGAKEYIVEGLTEYEADKILSYSANAKKPFVVVKEEMSDGKFLVATHEKNKVAVNYYAAISMFEDSNVSKEMASIVEGQAYLTQQRKEIEQAVDEVRNTNETKPAYVFSLNEPEKYVKINETSFEIHDRGNVTHRMNIAQNPELYADALKLICNSLALMEMSGEMMMTSDAKKVITNFQNKFSNSYIDSLCVAIIQALDSGEAVELLGDISEQLKSFQSAALMRKKQELDRALTFSSIVEFGAIMFFIIIISLGSLSIGSLF